MLWYYLADRTTVFEQGTKVISSAKAWAWLPQLMLWECWVSANSVASIQSNCAHWETVSCKMKDGTNWNKHSWPPFVLQSYEAVLARVMHAAELQQRCAGLPFPNPDAGSSSHFSEQSQSTPATQQKTNRGVERLDAGGKTYVTLLLPPIDPLKARSVS